MKHFSLSSGVSTSSHHPINASERDFIDTATLRRWSWLCLLLSLCLFLGNTVLAAPYNPNAPRLTVTRTPAPLVAGQPYSVYWSAANAESLSYSCSSSGSGFTGEGEVPLNGQSSGLAEPGWVGYPTTCIWTAVGADGSSSSAVDYFATNPAPLPAPTCQSVYAQASTTSATSGTFRIFATGVQNASAVSFPTWGDSGGQDDLVWYPGTNLGGGTWIADINLSNHKQGNPEFGNFNTHAYASNADNSNTFCGYTNWSRVQPLTPPSLNFSACSTNSPTVGPTAASMSCTLNNAGQTPAASISYSSLPGIHVQGPNSCAAGATCGTVLVTTDAAAGSYGGTLTAVPNTGNAASVPVGLVVLQAPTINVVRTPSPMVANQSHYIQWQTTNAASVSYRCTASGSGYQGSGNLTPVNGTSKPTPADPLWVGFDSTCVYTATSPEGVTATFTETLKTNPAPVIVDPQPTINIIRTPSPMVANQNQTLQWQTTNAVSLTYRCTSTGTGFQGSGSLTPLNGTAAPSLADPGWVGFDSTCVYTATSASGKTASYTEILKTTRAATVGAMPAAALQATPTNVRVNSGSTTPIVLTGSSSDSDGYITRLDLFQDSGYGENGSGYSSTPINTVTANSANATISHTQLLGAGLYRFKLRSTDNNGNFTESAPVIVNVTNSSLLGQVNGVRSDNSGNVTLNGWVCEEGNSQALNYQVYVKAPPNLGGQLLASGVANIATEKDAEAVQAQCDTPGISHHFQMDLNSYSAQYAGETVYVIAQTGSNSIVLPCSDNNCTVPGSLRIGLTTPVDGDHYTGVANVFMRAKLSNAAAPYDEIAFGIDNEWIAGAADTAADTYFANKTGLAPRSTPYLVMAKVRKGNSTVYSVANRIYVDGVVATTLTVNSPANGASVTSGTIVNLSATFTGTAGSVKFYANDILIASGTNNGGQWTAQWVAGAAASYAITAKAFDGAGTLLTTSPATNLTVTATPDSGTGALLPVNITPPHLGNPDAGTLPGSLDVNKNGGATYSMAIDVPPGTGGLQPQLTLNYDSQGNNSVLGLGWSLGGLSSIHRCGKTIAQDEVNGRISFDHGDRLCLDGQRLILANLPLTDDNYWADNAEYRTEIESFSRITAQGSGNQRSFKVESKDGRVMSFGNTADSFVQAIVGPVNSGTTAPQPQQKNGAQSWAISEMRDRSGNYVRFSYEQDDKTGEHHATFIRYGGNGSSSHAAVQLTYEGRPDAWKRYIDESRNDLRQRITHIKTYTGNNLDGDVSASGTIVRDYTMHYEQSPTSGRSLLNSVSACARNPQTGGMDCLPATTFAWGKPDPGKTPGFESKGIWAGAPMLSTFYNYGNIRSTMNHPDYFAFSDFENRGYTDILEKRVSGFAVEDVEGNSIPRGTMQTEYRYFHNNGNGFTQYAYKLNTGEAFIVLDTGDFDGDGALDLLVTTSGLESGHAKICLSPLGKSKELGAAGSTIIFTCDPNRPAVGANIASYTPYVVDARGDGRSVHYSTNNSDYVTVCIQDKCQRDLTPPLALAQVQGGTDGSTEYSQNQFVRLTQGVDFSGAGKPYDVRWTRVSPANFVRDGVDKILSPHYENLMPTVVINHFNLPGTPFGFGAMSSYTYKEYPQPPKNSFYLPYQFDRDTDMGGIATDFNGSGYNGLAFGFLELQWDPSNSYFSYGRAELTLCLSTGRALDCGVRKKYSGPEYVAIRAVGNFIGDGAPAFLADTLSYVPERKPRASGNLVMCRVMGDDTTDGNGTNDANITCTPWSGFNIPTFGTPSEKDNIFFLDLMGTGRTQIVQYHSGKYVGGNWQEDGRWEVFAPIDVAVAGQALDRIHQVTNGVGAVSTVQYVDGMVEGIVSQSGNSTLTYPQRATPRPGKIVRAITRNNGISNGSAINRTLSYRYEDAGVDVAGRGSIGFAKVISTDEQSNIVTSTTYSQTWPYVGMPLTAITTSSQSVALSSSTMTQKQVVINQANGQKTYFPYVDHSVVVTYDLDGSYLNTTTTDNQYTDGWGNLNQQDVKVDGEGGTFKSSTVTTYVNNNSTWVIGKPQSVALTKTDPVNGAISRQHHYDYDDSTGLLKSETQMPGNQLLQVVTNYDRSGNRFGLVNKKSETWYNPISTPAHGAPGQQTRVVTDVTYDPNGRFPTTVKDALGFATTYQYDAATGVKTKATDPNQLTTTWEVNAFGRVVKEVQPDSNEIRSYQKQCDSTCPEGAVVANIRDVLHNGVRIAVPQISYQDNAGHLLRTQSWGFDGRQTVQDQRYDTLGRLHIVEQPHYVGDPVYLDRTLDYDELNRVTVMTTYGAKGVALLTTTDYKGNYVTLTNARKYSRTDLHNALGKVISVIDAKIGVTQFSYDAFGNLLQTIDPDGNVINVQYDLLGRKTDLKDPDLGWIHYDVDALGRTWKQTSPNQRQLQTATSMEFDHLNRMTARFEPDLESHWVFDNAGNTGMAIGKLVEAYTGTPTQKDYRRLHYYDNLGRNNKTAQTLVDGIYTSTQIYDDWNRLSTQQYQRNNDSIKAYDSRYNSQGYLAKILRGPLALIEIKAQDAANRTSETWFGNGLKQLRQYDPNSGRLVDGQLTTNANVVHLHESYSYDNLGSVSQRTQYWDGNGFVEGFEYDELNRVHSSTVAGQAQQLFSYSAAGSLLSKGNVNNGATYSYPAQGAASVRPHAVQSIAGIGNFDYDNNGNMIAGAGRTMSWTSFDMPRTMSKGSINDSFAYGPEHQRTRQCKTSNINCGTTENSLVYAGAQEVEIKNGQTTVKTYWPNGLGVEIDKPGSNTSELNWTHLDRLGSVVGITDASGNLKEKLAYDAWGKRRTFDSSAVNGTVTPDSLDGQTDNKGYTGHEMLDDLDLVHMNGRVYEPLLGKFLSGDPFVQDPVNGQNYNRYSYVLNNPTNLTDPTGFRSEGCGDGIGLTINGCGDWLTVYKKFGDGDDNRSHKKKNDDPNANASRIVGEVNPKNNSANGANQNQLDYLYSSVATNSSGGQPSTSEAGLFNPGGTEGAGNIPSVVVSAPRPDNCQLICINQTTLLAYPRTFNTGDLIQDNVRNYYSRNAAPVWNAGISVYKKWAAASTFVMAGSMSGAGTALAKEAPVLSEATLAHIFRDAPGHINPATEAERVAFLIRVSELVSSSANSNPAIVVSSQAAAAGVQGFSRIISTGEQLWATVRNGTIINAGINAAKDVR